MPDDLKHVDTPKEPRFVAIAGDLYEIDDIIDALHGRDFTATLNEYDIRELGDSAGDLKALAVAQRQKTAALRRIVARSTDGLHDNLPNRAAILMALEKDHALRFSNITEFIARFAQLTPTDARCVANAVSEVHGKVRVLDGTQPLGGRFSQPTGHAFFEGRYLQSALGEGWIGGVWAEVTVAMIERALTDQNFTDDEWLQMFSGDTRYGEARGNTMSLKERLEDYASRAYVGGSALTALSTFGAMAVGEPAAIIVPAGFMAATIGSMVANVVIKNTPDTWLVSLAAQAATIHRSTRLSSASARQAGEMIPRYKELFKLTKARIEELKKTPAGRIAILLIQEVIGQEGGAFPKDEPLLELLNEWVSALQRSEALSARFNDFFEGYPAEAFLTAHDARERFIEFNRAQEEAKKAPAETAQVDSRKLLARRV